MHALHAHLRLCDIELSEVTSSMKEDNAFPKIDLLFELSHCGAQS